MTIPQFLSQIKIENITTRTTIEVAKQGLSPCGIIIPGNFDYPMEAERIVNAYTLFKSWANKASDPEFKTWYLNPDETTTIQMSEIIK